MKTMYLLISYFVLFSILPAHAILSPEPDQLGLYFDTEADLVCVDGIAPYTIVPDGTFVPTEMISPNGEWMAGFNSDCDLIPVSTEPQSFGAVKALYR